jgi:hypothetical protein
MLEYECTMEESIGVTKTVRHMQIRGALLRKRLVGARYRKRWEGECQLWALEIEVTLTLKSREVGSDSTRLPITQL